MTLVATISSIGDKKPGKRDRDAAGKTLVMVAVEDKDNRIWTHSSLLYSRRTGRKPDTGCLTKCNR